jgi:hypothetical protein
MGFATDVSKVAELAVKEIAGETDKAVMVYLEDGSKHWLPWSTIHKVVHSQDDSSAVITIDKWILDRRGIEY